MDELRQIALLRNLYGDSKTSAIASAGLCPSCRGSGLRPVNALSVSLDGQHMLMGLALTSPKAWSRGTRRSLVAFVVSVSTVAGWSTLTSVGHALL